MLLFPGDRFILVPMTASQSAFNDTFPLIMQADIDELFISLRQALLITNNIFICFLFKIITGKLRGILSLGTFLLYKEFFELFPPATLWSSASCCCTWEDALLCPSMEWTFSVPSPHLQPLSGHMVRLFPFTPCPRLFMFDPEQLTFSRLVLQQGSFY